MTEKPSIEDLRELLAKATPGPWKAELARTLVHIAGAGPVCSISVSPPRVPEKHIRNETVRTAGANAALIVAAVNALPALLDRLTTAERERDEARAALEERREFVETRARLAIVPVEPTEAMLAAAWDRWIENTEPREHKSMADLHRHRIGPIYRAMLAASPPVSAKALCDCERSHNGLGIVGRECDCPAGAAALSSPTTGAGWRAGAEAMREACAVAASTWKSPLRPGGTERLLGHGEASREIATAIRALPLPPETSDA